MLEIQRIRTEKESIIEGLKKRHFDASEIINDVLAADEKWRSEKGTASPFYFGPKDARHDYIFPNWMYGKNKMTKRGVKKCKLLHVFEVKKTWDEIIKLAGVERRDLKSLRHTFATFCVTKNVPLRMIQQAWINLYCTMAPQR